MQASASHPGAGSDLDLDAAIVDLMSRGVVRVPPYPAVAMKVQQLVRRQSYGLDELTKLVASDQALAADALRCANSAFYSRGSPVTSLGAAITRIGAKEVVRLALASGLALQARKPGPLGALKRRVWLEALASAALAVELARKRRVAPEEAFICALLHDFGKMVAVACIEEVLEGERTARPRPIEEWVEVIERYHVELGLVLAAQWELPENVSDAMSLHHGDASGAGAPAMVELMKAIDQVVALLGESAWLGPEDLAASAPAIAPAERETVARVLDRIPTFIASFEGDGTSAAAGASSLIEEPSQDHFMAGPTPVKFPVTVTVNRAAREYQALGIATNNLMVTGKTPIPENVLVEMRLASAPPLTCWGTAKLSWPEGDGYTVLLQPFALNGPSQVIWKEMVKATVS